MRKPRFSIRMQVLLLALAFTLIIAVGVCVASIRSYYRKATRTTAQSIEYNLQVAAGSLLQDVNEINNLADWCTVDSSIRGYALTSHWQTYLLSSYNTLLNKYSSQHTSRYLRRVLISDGQNRFLQQGTAITYSKALTAETVTSLPLFADGTNADSWTLIADDPLMTVSSGKIIPVLRTMANTSTETSARVYIAVSVNLITDAVSGYSLEDDFRLFWIMNGRAYELKDNSLLPVEIVLEGLEDVTDSFGPDLLDTRTRVMRQNGITILVYPVGNDGLYLAQTLPSISVMTTVTSMYMPLLGALLMILLLGLVLGMLLRRMIAVPVQALQTQLSVIGQGDFTPNPAIEWDNELGDIGRGINSLTRSVTALMERRLEDERQKKDLEYRMLQNQINPHFIYNTLNSIKWMATIQHAPGIAEMTMALSRLLKSVSKGNERLVPLQEEFALLNDYFTIQQYRYGGTITMDVTYIEDERLCRDCMIPRFTLQPLVENAIFHGIEPKGCAGNIEIVILRDTTGDVLIDLKDDGVGMTAEQAAKALSEPGPEEAAAKFRHVGMWNVHRRLQYSFGEGYGLSIRSEPGSGTIVTVRLPPADSAKGGNS